MGDDEGRDVGRGSFSCSYDVVECEEEDKGCADPGYDHGEMGEKASKAGGEGHRW